MTATNTVDLTGDNVADYTLTDFEASSIINAALDISDNGNIVYVEVGLTPIAGGAEMAAIIGVAVPEPTVAMALLGIGAMGVVRRRRA
ncbi:MAG: PEP-CTERM sorting domain-containing protein [Anaerolineae bacterium]|nr:PEP-CTERM sorting domain-containing protein [Phycisphaerae bacterium]